MNKQSKHPVVIGCGISGMMISRTLTQNKIRHTVVGKPMLSDSPVLGESMNEVTSLYFQEHYSEFKDYIYQKRGVTGFSGEYVSANDFTEQFLGVLYTHFKSHTESNNYLIHVDRIGFDRALYASIIQSEFLTYIDSIVTDVEYDKEKDTITGLQLQNGEHLHPSYVFDATNHVRLLGRKLELPFKEYDKRRVVFFTHYTAVNMEDEEHCTIHPDDEPWIHATNILFATKQHDDIDGVAWVIPFGKKYVSIGISMRPEDVGDLNGEEIITRLNKAYENRGLSVNSLYPRRKEIKTVPSQHFTYEKVYGRNWVLAGGAGCQAWFPSGSNIGLSVVLSKIAAKIADPSQPHFGPFYEKNIRAFEYAQEFYDRFVYSKRTPLDIGTLIAEIYEGARRRFTTYCLLENGEESRMVAEKEFKMKTRFFAPGKSFSLGLVREHCPELKEQTRTVYNKLASFLITETEEKITAKE